MSCYRNLQFQVGENYSYLFNLSSTFSGERKELTTLKFLIVAVALIRMKNFISQYAVPKVHLRLLLEVLYEKFNPHAAITLDRPVRITQPFMSNGQINICPINQFNAHISKKKLNIIYFV